MVIRKRVVTDESKGVRREIVALLAERQKYTGRGKKPEWNKLNRKIIALQRKMDALECGA